MSEQLETNTCLVNKLTNRLTNILMRETTEDALFMYYGFGYKRLNAGLVSASDVN